MPEYIYWKDHAGHFSVFCDGRRIQTYFHESTAAHFCRIKNEQYEAEQQARPPLVERAKKAS